MSAHPGGRPPRADVTRSVAILIRLTPAERMAVGAAAMRARATIADYVRALLAGAERHGGNARGEAGRRDSG